MISRFVFCGVSVVVGLFISWVCAVLGAKWRYELGLEPGGGFLFDEEPIDDDLFVAAGDGKQPFAKIGGFEFEADFGADEPEVVAVGIAGALVDAHVNLRFGDGGFLQACLKPVMKHGLGKPGGGALPQAGFCGGEDDADLSGSVWPVLFGGVLLVAVDGGL